MWFCQFVSMEKALLIAEKPDLMRKIESVYKKNKAKIPYEITFTSQRGHLVTLLLPTEMDEGLAKRSWEDLPIEPENYGGWQYKLIHEEKQGKFLTSEERYYEIKKEIDSGKYDFVIHAGDPDQEGELLVRTVLVYANNVLPVKRFWTNDLTEGHILKALLNLKDDDNDAMLTNLLDAAYARQHSDWRFGMNISRAASLKMNAQISCGRVKTPILAIVCKREEEIRNFKPKTVYGLKAKYAEGFDGTLFDKKQIVKFDENASEDQKNGIVWFDTREEAEAVKNTLGDTATIVSYKTKRTETFAPKLYKLATAQIDAGKMGYNDTETLDTIQSLYEREYLSYPRTDCEYLSSDEDFETILESLSTLEEYQDYCDGIFESEIERVRHSKKWINDKALQEAGHSALRPTTNVPDMGELTKKERDIYLMIVNRFVAMFLPPMIQDKTMVITKIDGKTFQSNGKTLVDPGYSVIFNTKFTDMMIPPHKEGDELAVSDIEIAEKTTVCPKRYTSPDLIAVCENPLKFLDDTSLKSLGKKLKIGTPATRSGIIRQLIDKNQYLAEEKEKKTTYIYPTEKGEAIIDNLNGLQICRVDMTGLWEEQLELIRNGEKALAVLENEMKQNVRDMVEEIKNKEMKTIPEKNRKIIGVCPSCGKELLENEKGYYCAGYKDGCKLHAFKTAFGFTFTPAEFIMLIEGKMVKKGDVEFSYDFENNKVTQKSLGTCPKCGKPIYQNEKGFYCSGHKDGCKIGIFKSSFGEEFDIEDFMTLANGNSVSKGLREFYYDFDKNKLMEKATTTTLVCPNCGEYLSETPTRYRCTCGFATNKVIANHQLTREDLTQLAENSMTDVITDFISKADNEFSARLRLNDNQLEFYSDSKETDYKCPCCQKNNLQETEKSYRCECGFTIWKTISNRVLEEQDIEQLCNEKETDVLDGFVSKKGKEFSCKLVVNRRKKAVVMEFE